MRRASEAASGTVWGDISLLLTDDEGIQSLNSDYLAKPEITDVLSFHYDPMPGDEDLHSAEIVVNVEEAVRAGRERKGSSPSRELALYIAHGCHHLTGATDNTAARRTAMINEELCWLRSAEELADGLLEQ